jgi:hypothetical protein
MVVWDRQGEQMAQVPESQQDKEHGQTHALRQSTPETRGLVVLPV